MFHKNFNFVIKNISEDPIKNIGIVEGFASTFGNTDREGDIMMPGAFTKSIQALRSSNQKLPMLAGHRDQIGGFDPNEMFENNIGLQVSGQIDLNIQEGREKYSLAKNGFLTSFSVAFFANRKNIDFSDDGQTRSFKEVELLEVSLVPIPANTNAVVTEVKGAMAYKNYPLMDQATPWSGEKATTQIKDKTGSTDAPSATYRNGFMWFDAKNADNFGAYKLPFVVVDDGSFKAVPRALSAIVAALKGGRGGVDIPAGDVNGVKRNVNGYFAKMGRELPFGDVGSPKSFERDERWIEKNDESNIITLQKLDGMLLSQTLDKLILEVRDHVN